MEESIAQGICTNKDQVIFGLKSLVVWKLMDVFR